MVFKKKRQSSCLNDSETIKKNDSNYKLEISTRYIYTCRCWTNMVKYADAIAWLLHCARADRDADSGSRFHHARAAFSSLTTGAMWELKKKKKEIGNLCVETSSVECKRLRYVPQIKQHHCIVMSQIDAFTVSWSLSIQGLSLGLND